ncbi:MAG: hypothetical protein ACI4PF_03850 [Christensenellales bacterium]
MDKQQKLHFKSIFILETIIKILNNFSFCLAIANLFINVPLAFFGCISFLVVFVWSATCLALSIVLLVLYWIRRALMLKDIEAMKELDGGLDTTLQTLKDILKGIEKEENDKNE